MKRTFVIRYADDFPKSMWKVSGIYALKFGDSGKYYIGRSVDVKRRSAQHLKEFKKMFSLQNVPTEHYLFKCYNLLIEQPRIKIIYIHLLRECSDEDLSFFEQMYLDVAKEGDNCLNVGFTAKPSSHDIKIKNALHRLQATKGDAEMPFSS